MAENIFTTTVPADKYYLDLGGLSTFWGKVKEYISNQIKAISGEDLKLYDSTDKEENPTITSKIEDLQEVIGDSEAIDGSLVENIDAIKKDVETNAEICATALTDLDKRLTQLSTDVETNELVCANALTNLNVRLKNVEAGVASSYNAGVLTIITSHNTETEEPDLESTTN